MMTGVWDYYPAGWPACAACGEPALDGHATCGRLACDERADWGNSLPDDGGVRLELTHAEYTAIHPHRVAR